MNAESLLVPSMGLHHRRHPGEEDDPRREKTKGIVKHRDSNDFDDVESPRPVRYTEGATALDMFPLDNSGLNNYNLVECGDTYHDDVGFGSMILDRAGWLVGLLVLQSMSSFIIQRNETMLQKHLVIVRFLTMLVGAGGNAGNQASVRGACRLLVLGTLWDCVEFCAGISSRRVRVRLCRMTDTLSPLISLSFFLSLVIRGLATGSIKGSAVRSFLGKEFSVGLCLSVILGIAGWLRAAAFATPFLETMAITASLFMIVMISVVLGATLPLGMRYMGIDPAHSSTTIQVLMDILGVTITVCVSGLVLGSI